MLHTNFLIKTKKFSIIRIILFSVFILFINSSAQAEQFAPLSSGMNSVVRAVTVYNGELIAAGYFSTAGGTSANRIARWNGTSWSSLGSGMNNYIYALMVYNNELYAAGSFTNAGGVTANRIAKWNGSSWSALGLGLSGSAYSLGIFNNKLIVGGYFTTAGGINVNNIASWNGSWSALGSGTNSAVYALNTFNNKLIVGGAFSTIGGVPVNKIASWDGSNWTSLASGLDNGSVYALTVFGNDLIVGGSFNSASGVSASRIAKWSGTSWSALGSGTSSTVYSFTHYLGNLYVGGSFTTAGGIFVNRIARWNGSAWAGIGGVNNSVRALCVFDANLILGGYFTTAGTISANRIAKWGAIPVQPTLVSPPNGATNVSQTPTLEWNSIPNATDYGMQLTDDPNFLTTILDITGITENEYSVPTGVLLYNKVYFWRVNARNGLGTSPYSIIWFFSTGPTNITSSGEIPNEYRLYANYPNPFNPTTNIKFDIPKASNVKLIVYNQLGQEVASLVNKELKSGSYEYTFNADRLSSGVYFYKIIAGSFTDIKKMTLIK